MGFRVTTSDIVLKHFTYIITLNIQTFGSAYGGQRPTYLSTLAGVANILDGVEAVGGVRATEKPPPQTIGGKPCRIFLPPPTTCIDNQQEGRLAENSAHPGVGRIQRQATGPPQHTPWGVIPAVGWYCHWPNFGRYSLPEEQLLFTKMYTPFKVLIHN